MDPVIRYTLRRNIVRIMKISDFWKNRDLQKYFHMFLYLHYSQEENDKVKIPVEGYYVTF